MVWEISTTGGRFYNPETHTIRPKKEFIDAQIEREKGIIEKYKEAEMRNLEYIHEAIKASEENIKELEKQREELD